MDMQGDKKAKQVLQGSSHGLRTCKFELPVKVKGAGRRSALWRLRGAHTPSAHLAPPVNQVSDLCSRWRANGLYFLHLTFWIFDCTDAFQVSSHCRGLWDAVRNPPDANHFTVMERAQKCLAAFGAVNVVQETGVMEMVINRPNPNWSCSSPVSWDCK